MFLTARAIPPRRHESIKRPPWRHPKIENIRRDTPLLFSEESREIKRLQNTKAKEGRILDRSEEQFLFGIRDRLNAKVERLKRQLKNGRLNGQRRLIEKELVFIDKINEMLLSMIVATNQKMVRNIAIRFMSACSIRHMDLNDLIQEGNIGLFRAIEKFEVSRGYRFYTYAQNWVRQRIWAAIAEMETTVTVPSKINYAQMRIRRFVSKYYITWNKDPTVNEIAEGTGFSMDAVKKALAAERGSIVFELNENDHPDVKTPLDIAVVKELERLVTQCVAGLKKERERYIIKRRFGLDGKGGAELETIGSELNLTRERVRQIESVIMDKLSHAAKRAGLASC
jgi:RNA polymerase sigma factor (sigma-70 family)